MYGDFFMSEIVSKTKKSAGKILDPRKTFGNESKGSGAQLPMEVVWLDEKTKLNRETCFRNESRTWGGSPKRPSLIEEHLKHKISLLPPLEGRCQPTADGGVVK